MLSLRTKVISFIGLTLVFSALGGLYLFKHFLEIKQLGKIEINAHRLELNSGRLADCLRFTNLNCHELSLSLLGDLNNLNQLQELSHQPGFRDGLLAAEVKSYTNEAQALSPELESLSNLKPFNIDNLNKLLGENQVNAQKLQSAASSLTDKWVTRIASLFTFGIIILLFFAFFGYISLKRWKYKFDDVMVSFQSQNEKQQELKKKINEFEEAFDSFSGREKSSLEKSNDLINVIKVHGNNLNTHINHLSSEGNKSKLTNADTQLPVDKLRFMIEQIQDCNEFLNELNKAVGNINTNIDTIKSISLKTQLLAINAAVEASKAGHLGKGFSVVAEEMGKLSIVSREAANTIQNHIQQHEKLLKKVNKYIYDSIDNGLSTLETFDKISKLSTSYMNSIIVKSTKIPLINAKYAGKFNLLSSEVKALHDLNDLRSQVQELSREINRQVTKQIKNENDLITDLSQLVNGNQHLSIENLEKYFFDLNTSKKKKKIRRLVS